MSSSEIKRSSLEDLARGQSLQSSHLAVEALRIATESTAAAEADGDRFLEHLRQHSHGQRQHIGESSSHENGNEDGIELTEYDLKSRDSKYKRWSPKMDQYLISLLSDIVHSFPKGVEPEMTKKAWAYVTGKLRAANPETVYSTYTKYSCQQHLINVNHHRYKIWYVLVLHQKNNSSQTGYSYRWNPDVGRFQVIDESRNSLILDERQVKSLLYGDSLSLPSLSSFNKGNLIASDFFLSDNLRYISVYHNEVLPLLIKMDSKFAEDLGDIYAEIPKFDFRDSRKGYFKPLIPVKLLKSSSPNSASKPKKRVHSSDVPDVTISFAQGMAIPNGSSVLHEDDSVDPVLKRSRNIESTDFENVLASAAIAAINSPPVSNGRDSTPLYIKDRKWFNKLLSYQESGHLSVSEVLSVCEGVRDGKIPLFMLNVLDNSYYSSSDSDVLDLTDDEVVKRIREFMIPMTYNS
ncbi:uncharacterized protein PRCAT00005149001 [Priceomyces carsonii]|uniref:uncharacterized protein n=1 Tax=Priceomyces carsonii TaxID=28549 RepID=UPI002EDB0526|nr:unnamed protein product [Priceomyces carsonii]